MPNKPACSRQEMMNLDFRIKEMNSDIQRNFREAIIADIEQMHIVRNAVNENRLSDPNRITKQDYEEYLIQRGKGWLCEIDKKIVGFSIADLKDQNIWALFVHPDYEDKGIGKNLHDLMLSWYFENTKETVWLSTASGTRAEIFYIQQGWQKSGLMKNREIKFEMSHSNWMEKNK